MTNFDLEQLKPKDPGPRMSEIRRAKTILSSPDVQWAIGIMLAAEEIMNQEPVCPHYGGTRLEVCSICTGIDS